ncbi:MAG TPA: ATP-binding protein [Burkholderiaceae bacterium]|nr:ATP-binding protein [Burkholderiaceae bacterium]
MPGERSDRTVYLRVLGPLAVATLALLVLSVGGFHALSGARAYAGGESMWSKARSRAIVLVRSQPSADCHRIDALLEVPLGARDARLALDESPPNLEVAARGLVRGGNDPADVDAMIHFYLNFGSLPPVREAIQAWKRGDLMIAQLRDLGMRICAQAQVDPNPVLMAPLLQELDRLEAGLADSEQQFSRALGRASRIVETTLTIATLVVALGMAGGGAWFAVVSLRSKFAQQRALQDANNRWELAADAANIGLFVWRPGDDQLVLDPRARKLYGLDPDPSLPIPRADVLALLHPDDRQRIEASSRAAAEGGSALLRGRYRVIRPDGELRHIDAIGMLRESEGGAPQMFGLLRDVTDEVSGASFQLEKEAAERTARARTEFLSRLSHELRTPLNAILGLAQVIEMDPGEPLRPRQAMRMKLLLESGWQLLHLVDDVLDITAIDSGFVTVRSAPTDLRSVVDTSLSLVEPERQAFEIEVRNEVPEQLEPVLADPRRLQQVLVNLFSNACKYNRRGGRLTIGCRDLGLHVCLDIQDEGVGLSEAELAELFQPFKRLAKTTDVPGTGLGLTVVKMLVGQMDGTVEVTSELGRGTRFTVCLPRAQTSA